MTETGTFDQMIDIMLSDDDDALSSFILTESEKDTVVAAVGGDLTLMNYMMLFEEYLEQHDIYLFKGWEDAQFVGSPVVEKFWVTFHILVSAKTDLRGAKRVNNAMKQGRVTSKRQGDGSILLVFQILKRNLDQIERTNAEKIEQLSDRMLEQQ